MSCVIDALQLNCPVGPAESIAAHQPGSTVEGSADPKEARNILPPRLITICYYKTIELCSALGT